MLLDDPQQMDEIRRSTQSVYERQADNWDQIRSTSLYEKPWLDQFLSTLPARGRLLDLGCGSGIPVAGYFLAAGHDLVGIDYAPTMINLAQRHYPQAQWHVQDMTQFHVEGKFDGIYSWDGFFHLSIPQQRHLLPLLSQKVKAGGAILLTVGTGEGEVTGTVAGETVYHASLFPEEYQRLLHQYGFENVSYVSEDPEALGRSIILASQKSCP
ncbi:MAG: class I SAM-dependent methyltransferase [Parasphingorhabdus sp.]|uniref:class I SAM-dependent DNA methyltransferase n=1 Tax=Parasphingorhabdus sp. TaxID=2709688 RepID=UPI003297CBB0